MLRKERRAIGMVWVFRWSEEVNGRRRQHKDVIGTTKEFPTEAAANKEADRRRCEPTENVQEESFDDIACGELVDHEAYHQLDRSSKTDRRRTKPYIKNCV